MKTNISRLLIFFLAIATAFGQSNSVPKDCSLRHSEYRQLPNDEKAALWNERLRNVLDSGFLPVSKEKLNPTQREVLVKWIEVLQPGFIEALQGIQNRDFINTSTPFGQKIVERLQQIFEHFKPEDGHAIFETLPGFEDAATDFLPTCGCSTTWTFCGFESECSTANPCGEIIDCGPFWQFMCNGRCSEVPSNDRKRTPKGKKGK